MVSRYRRTSKRSKSRRKERGLAFQRCWSKARIKWNRTRAKNGGPVSIARPEEYLYSTLAYQKVPARKSPPGLANDMSS